MKIFAIKITNLFTEQLFIELVNYLRQNRQERIEKFRKFKDAQRALLGELIVRVYICNLLNIKNKDVL